MHAPRVNELEEIVDRLTKCHEQIRVWAHVTDEKAWLIWCSADKAKCINQHENCSRLCVPQPWGLWKHHAPCLARVRMLCFVTCMLLHGYWTGLAWLHLGSRSLAGWLVNETGFLAAWNCSSFSRWALSNWDHHLTGPEERNCEWSGQKFQKMRGGASHRGHV